MIDFSKTRSLFHLPEGVIYLDGNSLGPLPKSAHDRARTIMEDEWGQMLIAAWNQAGWMQLPGRLGDRISRLIGAPNGSTVVGDTLSIKIYQALSAALQLNPARRVVLSDTGNFPSDLYMADGLLRTLNSNHVLKTVEPEAVAAAIDETVATVMLTQVDYRTGRLHDIDRITARARSCGAVMIWDLAHSAGALPIDISASRAEFAVGCTYKYLNGGPGAPAFIYVRPDIAGRIQSALCGWLGHEAPFEFDAGYRPGRGIERMRVGTPPVIQMAVLDAALDVWDLIDMKELRARSIALSEQFIAEVEAQCADVVLASPRNPAERGSQVSFRFREGYAAIQALAAEGVIGDFRAPDIMRFGFCPLYNTPADVRLASAALCRIINTGAWNKLEFKIRKTVT